MKMNPWRWILGAVMAAILTGWVCVRYCVIEKVASIIGKVLIGDA